jgi:hypothetical protein
VRQNQPQNCSLLDGVRTHHPKLSTLPGFPTNGPKAWQSSKPDAEAVRSCLVGKHEPRHLAIIERLYSEVWLDPFRETHGHGQGSGLSGEAESRVAGFRFAPFAAAN